MTKTLTLFVDNSIYVEEWTEPPGRGMATGWYPLTRTGRVVNGANGEREDYASVAAARYAADRFSHGPQYTYIPPKGATNG